MENIFVEFLPPWVETGIQPAFYDKESGTVLQQTARMYARVNMLIRMFNKLSKQTKEEIESFEQSVNETVEDYIEKFNELYNYVHDYFDNLDVQEEINHKLDEMVEDGTLPEIVADYLNSRALFGYDTVADMKASTNLIDGSFAQTLGYYAKSDGGEATYKIRTKTAEDTVDEIFIYQMASDSDLVAELILDDNVNVKQFGVKADGTTDNATRLSSILSSGVKRLYFPNGTYLVNSALTITNCPEIAGEDQKNTIIKAPSGFLTWSSNNGFRHIHDLKIDGVSINSNIGIDGIFETSKIENTTITNYQYGIKTSNGTWINEFNNLLIYYCDYGFYHTADAFNNNTFTNCYFQHINQICVSIGGFNNKFIGCNFENSNICFNKGSRITDIDSSYFESNNYIFNINTASYEESVRLHDSWLTPKSSDNSNGWLAKLFTVNDPSTVTATLMIENCWINNRSSSLKPFAFQTNGNKTYWGVSVKNNYYQNIGGGYKRYYDELFDTTNCPYYTYPANPVYFESDIPLYKHQHILWFRKSLGNQKGAGESNNMIHMTGYCDVTEFSSGYATITPDKRYGCVYPELEYIPVYVRFTDNTIGNARMKIDAGNFYIWPDFNGKTVNRIIFDTTYYNGY